MIVWTGLGYKVNYKVAVVSGHRNGIVTASWFVGTELAFKG